MVSLAQISLDPFCNSTHPTSSFLSPSIFLKKRKSKWTTTKKDKRWQNKTNWNKMTLQNMWIIVCVGQLRLGACPGVWLICPLTLSGQSCFPYPNSDQLQIACSSGGWVSAPLCSEVFALHELSLCTSVYAASLFFKFICASVLFCLSSCSLISW